MAQADCENCNAQCCRYFCFEIDEPTSYDEFEDVRWYLLHQGVTVHIDEGSWYMSIANPCRMLDKSNRCTIYERRPLICRKYSQDNCDATHGDYQYEELFETAEQLEAYAIRTLGEKKFLKRREKARRKLDGKAKPAEEEKRRSQDKKKRRRARKAKGKHPRGKRKTRKTRA